MTSTVTINAIATDVVGHYGNAAKNLVAAYSAASERALAAGGTRYAKLVERLPIVGDEGKARIVAAERRVAEIVGEGVQRTAAGFAVASFAWRAFNSWAWLSTAAALAGSVLIVTPPLVPWARAPAVAKDIRRTRPILFMLASRSC